MLDATDVEKFLAMGYFRHYELHKAVYEHKLDWIWTKDFNGIIPIFIQIILQS